jgi:thiamine-monophosphate kinase
MTRSGAAIGDLIGVTNTFGDAGAGVDILYARGAKYKFSKEEKHLISKQNKPRARLAQARIISNFATSMTDASDGLFVSIGLLAKGVDVFCEKIPISKELLKAVPDAEKRLDYALFGSEDYELVFTLPESKSGRLKKLLPEISYVGRVNSLKRARYFYDGKERKTVYCGYKHF